MFEQTINRLYRRLGLYRFSAARRLFWDLQAGVLERLYGQNTVGFEAISHAIEVVGARRIFDFGCGRGRLFPLYGGLGVKEVVGQDISKDALHFARGRMGPPPPRIHLIEGGLEAVDFPDHHFDLTLSVGVLQHIPAEDLDRTLARLAQLSRFIFMIECSEREREAVESFYKFRHDYTKRLAAYGLVLREEGIVVPATGRSWFLYGPAEPAR